MFCIIMVRRRLGSLDKSVDNQIKVDCLQKSSASGK